jgi:hypothetical protein
VEEGGRRYGFDAALSETLQITEREVDVSGGADRAASDAPVAASAPPGGLDGAICGPHGGSLGVADSNFARWSSRELVEQGRSESTLAEATSIAALAPPYLQPE